MQRTCIVNGNAVDEAHACISVFDKGYFFDFSVYSSLKVVQGKIFFPTYHIERLFESAALIGIVHSFTTKDVLSWLKKTVEINALKDALLRILLIGDPDALGQATLYCIPLGGLTFYPDSLYRDGAKAITYAGERRIPNAKTKDLLLGFLAYREALAHGALDALLIDKEGTIREGTRTNFFAFKDDVLITPPREFVLDGITKKIILEAARGRFKIQEAPISLKAIATYSECFITSTSMNVMPLRYIDTHECKGPFSKTRELQTLFRAYCKEHSEV
ncbi:aminotransferase class IV [Candidatus Uhrbacteria bacterium]|nr:aminotransferase class IV [Candidatus Uhrbacteria bacterium]